MNATRILLLCSSRLALPALQQLAFLNILAGVVVPRHCDEMVENLQFVLQQFKVPLLVVDKENYASEIAGAIEEYNVTMGLMITFSFKIPATVYQLPAQGFFNVHPGPLPQYRGADPVFQQIKNREKQAGVTIHLLSEKFDTGPVVMQEMIVLKPTDTYGLLTSKLAETTARMVLTLLKLISFEMALPQRLQDERKARYFKKHLANDVAINWLQMDGAEVIGLMNACNPWNKGATTQLNGKIIRLLEASLLPAQQLPAILPPAGTILGFHDGSMVVATHNNSAINISMLYMDEGFLHAARLQEMGVIAGMQFQNVF